MNNIAGLIGFVLVIIAAGLLFGLSLLQRRRSAEPTFREIPAFMHLKRALGISVEAGTRLHVSLGNGNLQTPSAAPGLAGLAMLRDLAEQTSAGDKPPVVTSGAADLALLSQDTLQAGYKAASAEELYDPATARLTGLTPFSYVVGAIPIIKDEDVSSNIFIGHFGPEIALLTDAAERNNSQSIAAAIDPSAQALIYASATDPLIGEELFAAGAYTGTGSSHRASLQVQDILRWAVILVLLIGSFLKLAGAF